MAGKRRITVYQLHIVAHKIMVSIDGASDAFDILLIIDRSANPIYEYMH